MRKLVLCLALSLCGYVWAPLSQARAATPKQTITLKELRERLDYVQDNLISYHFHTPKGAGLFKMGKRVSLFNVDLHFEGYPKASKKAKSAKTMYIVGLSLTLGSVALMGGGFALMMAELFSPTPTASFGPLFSVGMALELGSLALIIGAVIAIANGGRKFGRAIELHNQEVYRRAGLPPAKNRQARSTPPPPAPASTSSSHILMQLQ